MQKINSVTTFTILAFFLVSCTTKKSDIPSRLGYPEDTKLLIIHADDLGVTHSENIASIKGMEETCVNSSSIMVPCPWFTEIATYAKENSSMDFGLHLTLNSEWPEYKWGPVTHRDSVPSLVDENGHFYPSRSDLKENAKPEEVVIELRNQIKKALRAGIDVTHLDAHMSAAVSTPEFTEAYMQVGNEFQLPVLLSKDNEVLDDSKVLALVNDNTVIFDEILIEDPVDYEKGAAQYYTNVLKSIEPGLNCLLIHLAYDDTEMQSITGGIEAYGSAWRQADFDYFSSPECKRLLEENNIVLITWRELRDKITRGKSASKI
ncbi:MAG: polysaccharide deacetylase family protein [Flavobacteriaceae bacterium]